MNGAAQGIAAAQENGGVQPVITVQVPELTFSWAQVWKVMVLVWGGVTSAYAAGWLFVPAKQDDLKALQVIVQAVRDEAAVTRQETAQNRDAITKLAEAVDRLSGLVNDVKEEPPKVIERLVPVPPKPAPKPR